MTSPNNRRTGWSPTTTTTTTNNSNNISDTNKITTGSTLTKVVVHPPSSHLNDSAEERNAFSIEKEMRLRKEYFESHYKLETGLRIAGTLGGFFLLVLLTLLYKSRGKKHHHSKSQSPLNLNPLMLNSHPHPNLNPNQRQDLLEEEPFLNLNGLHQNQVYPRGALGGTSCSHSGRSSMSNHIAYPIPYMTSPAVLLTIANSESSEEEEEEGGEDAPNYYNYNQGQPILPLQDDINKPRYGLCPNQNQYNQFNKCSKFSSYSKTSKWLGSSSGNGKQNIDIHVILPTPTISPSGSEHFGNISQGVPLQLQTSNKKVLPPGSSWGFNKQERERSSSVGSGASSFNPPPAPGLFFLDNLNLKYVDDTSSENIPTNLELEFDEDNKSIASDSLFPCFDHNFDQIAESSRRRISSGSGYSGLSLTLTQAQVEVHSGGGGGRSHRDSFCSELESVADYLEVESQRGGNRRRSSSTQTTYSDLQQCLNLSRRPSNSSSGGGSRLVPNFNISGANNLLSVLPLQSSPKPNRVVSRKASLDPSNKSYSLQQCDEPNKSFTRTKSPNRATNQ